MNSKASFPADSSAVVSRQRKPMLALQQRDLGQLTGLFGQVATDRADRPGQLIPRVQLRIGNRAFEQLAVAIAQGQQNAAVRAGLSGHFVVARMPYVL